MESSNFKDRLKNVAQTVEKFVEHNLIEKEQRDENLRKLAIAFETFLHGDSTPGSTPDGSSVTVNESSFERLDIKVKFHEHYVGELPEYQSQHASGFDVRAQITEPILLEPGARALVPTGLSFAIPAGYELQARPRSGWAYKEGVTLLNAPGTIDADYRGEVKIILVNLGQAPVTINNQDRIAQLVLVPVLKAQLVRVDELDETGRGDGGLGSTGQH